MRHLSFRVLFKAIIIAELRQVFTVKLDINTVFTPKTTQSPAILTILSATRSLLTSKFMMLLVSICKTAISVIASVSFKVGRI